MPMYYNFIYIYSVAYKGLVDQQRYASGAIFNGGQRTETKFTK